MEVAQKVAKKRYGLTIKIINFTDYTMLNEALNNGDLDANMFQHTPYLKAQIKQKGYKLTILGKGFVYPIGIYTKKLKIFKKIKIGSKVAIPNDPSNEARALLLIEKAGLIKLATNADVNTSMKAYYYEPKAIAIYRVGCCSITACLR